LIPLVVEKKGGGVRGKNRRGRGRQKEERGREEIRVYASANPRPITEKSSNPRSKVGIEGKGNIFEDPEMES